MSTNFYLRTPETPEGDEGVHLGQYAAGGFTFRAHPDRGVTDYESWLALARSGTVFAESGYEVTVDELVETAAASDIRASWAERGATRSGGRGFYDDEGRRWLAVEFC